MRGIFPDIPGIPDIPDNVCSTPTSLPATYGYVYDDALCYALQVLKKSHVLVLKMSKDSQSGTRFMAEMYFRGSAPLSPPLFCTQFRACVYII